MLIYHSEASDQHLTPAGHPERAARVAAVLRGLEGVAAQWRESPIADEADILRAHSAGHVAQVQGAAPRGGLAQLDADTFMSEGSHEAALRAVGGAVAAVDAVLVGDNERAFVIARPPGHHAERDRAMGFCLFSTVAIAALRAIHHHGLARVAVVDFDVHHGNGTQDVLWDEERCFFASTHQMPLYPGSGAAGERGALPDRWSGCVARAERAGRSARGASTRKKYTTRCAQGHAAAWRFDFTGGSGALRA
jgi:acetoin utilization deacetylase AcuC-like enzyme